MRGRERIDTTVAKGAPLEKSIPLDATSPALAAMAGQESPTGCQSVVREVRADQRIVPLCCVDSMTGPPVVEWRSDDSGANRIKLDAAAAAEQTGFTVDGALFVAYLPERAAAMAALIDVSDMPPPEELHDSRDLPGAGWGCKQVGVVGHRHIGVKRATFLQADLAQRVPVGQPIHVGKEARLPIIAALDDVLGGIRRVDSRLARHGIR